MTLTYKHAKAHITKYLSDPFPDSHWGPAHIVVEDNGLRRASIQSALNKTNAAILMRIACDMGFFADEVNEVIELVNGHVDEMDAATLNNLNFYLPKKEDDPDNAHENLETLVATKTELERLLYWMEDGDIEYEEDDE